MTGREIVVGGSADILFPRVEKAIPRCVGLLMQFPTLKGIVVSQASLHEEVQVRLLCDTDQDVADLGNPDDVVKIMARGIGGKVEVHPPLVAEHVSADMAGWTLFDLKKGYVVWKEAGEFWGLNGGTQWTMKVG